MTDDKKQPIDKTIQIAGKGIQLASVDDAWRFATMVAKSGLAPKSMQRPEQILVAIQTGMEAGLTPMRALSSVVVINGTPSWKGDAALALVRNSGRMKQWWKPSYVGAEGQADWGCCVKSQRADEPEPVTTCFTVADAKKAGLWPGKSDSAWSKYPKRMLYYRALGFHLRDQYGDVLIGLAIHEEVRDYPASAFDVPVDAEPVEHEPDPLLESEDDQTAAAMTMVPGEKAGPVEVTVPPPDDDVTGHDIDALFNDERKE